MAFSEAIKTQAMVACGRRCCLCHKFCGNNMEVHHIRAKADGGSDDYSNAIPLCFDCHAEVRQYDSRHPKGIRFTEDELIQHRDNWYKQVSCENRGEQKQENKPLQPLKLHRQKGYRDIVLTQIRSGNELVNILQNANALEYAVPDAAKQEEAEMFSEIIQQISDWIDYFSFGTEPSETIMIGYRLNNIISELDKNGFFLFGAKEIRALTGGLIETSESFPVALIRIIRKEDPQIIRVKKKANR